MGTVSRHNPRLQEWYRGSLQPCHPPKCWEGTKGGRSLPLHHRGAGVGGMGATGSAGPPEALRSPSLQHLHAAGTGDTGSAGSAGSLRACRSPPMWGGRSLLLQRRLCRLGTSGIRQPGAQCSSEKPKLLSQTEMSHSMAAHGGRGGSASGSNRLTCKKVPPSPTASGSERSIKVHVSSDISKLGG